MAELESQSLTSSTNNSILHFARTDKAVAVRHRGQSSLLRVVLTIAEVIVVGHSVTIIGGVERLLATGEGVGFDEKLSTLASVDTIAHIQIVAVVNMAGAESERRSTGVDVVPVVVVHSDMQIACVLISIAVRVADE